MIRIALYQPDIPQNTGTILRTAACFGLSVDVVQPAGFRLDDRALARAGLDYAARACLVEHASFEHFREHVERTGGRIVLFSSRVRHVHTAVRYRPGDALLFGRESAGVPPAVHEAADLSVTIAMRPGMRSLNVAVAAGIGAAEALRQLGGPGDA